MEERTLPLMLRARTEAKPDIIAQYAKDETGTFKPKTFREFYDEMQEIAAGLLELGAERGSHIGLISDNRQEWFVTDYAVLSIGAADVPRGCDTTGQEIEYILGFSECSLSIAENQKQAEKILARSAGLPLLKTLICFDQFDESLQSAASAAGIGLYHYAAVREMGKKRRAKNPGEIDAEIDKGQREDLATIIFTSGTTGEPKGVMLTHGTFLHQLPSFARILDIKPGDIWLSVLPVWHSFERAIEYAAPCYHSGIAYSKPVAGVLMADFVAVRPQWMVGVPRIWEAIMDGIYRNIKQQSKFKKSMFNFLVSLGIMHNYFRDLTFGLLPNFHGRVRILDALMGFLPWLLLCPAKGLANILVFNKIKARLGGRFRAGISGGGALPAKADHFFNAVGLKLLEGYGLTETSPIVSCRYLRKARPGTVGQLFLNTEAKITDDHGTVLSPGQQGIIHIRGGQVMKGYYNKPEVTAAVLSEDGWLNTGDLGMMTYDNELKITGRAKDTIVLRGGENVEPVPIEQKICESEWIRQCMVVGQDQKYLAAIIVPVQEMVLAFAEENNIPIVDYELLLHQPEINEVVANEVADLVNPHSGFKPFERVFKFKLVPKPFEPGVELSPKQELMRHRVSAIYAREIGHMFRDKQ
ncbi:AMP-dependent synthetase/ligase [Breznakiella homolactica]|uniref:Long-chain fatty acid--CoA ligase n=1 Tax=Breznakiella homolactica TaxID=2798577 RepID=A0A7T7XQ67_9SPIR|nr:long-chain fatty acid--CoA ligase [Breznakiella homolactica]QQO10433.1 long-chain fatty acid--CoA ligase [Breznakiella homolactica]